MTKKVAIAMAVLVVLTAALSVVALADAPDTTAMMQTGFQSVVSEIMGIIAIVVPIALGVIGAVIAIRFGIRWFRSLVGR
jgi:uncharacterized membrane-anchored protein